MYIYTAQVNLQHHHEWQVITGVGRFHEDPVVLTGSPISESNRDTGTGKDVRSELTAQLLGPLSADVAQQQPGHNQVV